MDAVFLFRSHHLTGVVGFLILAGGAVSCVTLDSSDSNLYSDRLRDPLGESLAESSHQAPKPVSSVGNGLSQDEVLQVLKPHVTRVQACYQRLRLREPELQGLIKIRLMIELDGLVHQFEILEQNVHSTPLEACISEGLKEAVFRKPRGPIPVSVIYTYRFSGLVEVPPEKG